MSHPVIPLILEIAMPLATGLDLEVVDVVFQTNKRPPVLRVDIRNSNQDTSLDDCATFSRALEAQLDGTTLLPEAYVLEVSSPGIARQLSSDRDFLAFKGFGVIVTATEAFAGHSQWQGSLQGRDEDQVYLNLKGRAIALPRQIIATVQLDSQR
ncbi:MAG: ribosome maturation factor RimP [Microcystaceae cyanobacterium]